MLKSLSDEDWKKKSMINTLNKEVNTIRHIVTDNVTTERKHLPKSNILSYHNILFLFLPFME